MQNFSVSDASSPSNFPPVPDATACPKCGSIAIHVLKPGKPPHAWGLHCCECGAFVRWYSAKTREAREAQHAYHRNAALAAKPPTTPQLAYLNALGFSGSISSCLSASQAIDALLTGRGQP